MAQLSNEDFYKKWVPLLADNAFQDINGERFEQLLADMRDTFAPADSANTQPVAPAVNFDPVLRQLTATHPLGVGELEYTHNNGGFTAYAPIQVDDLEHSQGEWRFRVKADTARNPSQTTDSPPITVKSKTGSAGPLSITANQISDAGAAGKALLRAGTTDDQLAMLDYLHLVDYPQFVRVYGEVGAVKYLLDQVKQLKATAAPSAPAAPTDGQVEDTADTLSGKLVPGYAAVADYEVFGAPGFPGIVSAATAAGDVQNGRIYSRGLTGSILVGGAGIRVVASGNRPAGGWLLNDKPFTGVAVTTPPATTTTYTATQQSYTTTEADYQAACGKAYEGAFVGVMRSNSSETSTNSQAEANAKALAAATQAAKNAITCQVQPVAYDNTAAAGQTVKGVTLGAQSNDTLEFNNASGADNSAVTMELWLSGEQLAAVPYENYYTGKPFRFTHNALKYTKNFAAGRIDL